MSIYQKLTDKLEALLEDQGLEHEIRKHTLSKTGYKRKHKTLNKHIENVDELGNGDTNEDLTPRDQSKCTHLDDNGVIIDSGNNDYDELNFNKASGLPQFLKGLQSSDGFVEAKVAELSQKIRDLNTQLICTQDKLKIAEKHLTSQESIQKETVLPKEVDEDKITELETELKELNDKYHACNTKLCEYRNQIQQYKHEIKLLHKALTSEVGDGYNIHTVTSEGWRGRAQQICHLQQKVLELSEKLSLTSIPSIEKSVSAVQSFEKSQDKERISSLTKELDELKVQFSDTKNKGDQARARANVLSSEISVLKIKCETLTAKNEEDTKFINTLTTKLSNISQKNHDREINLIKKYDEQLAALNTELNQERVKSEQLQKIVFERDVKIKALEEKFQDYYEQSPQTCCDKNESIRRTETSGFISERPSTQQSLNSNCIIYSQSIEVERIRLMELITVLNKRLDEERKTLDKLQDHLRTEKQKSAKLESKLKKLELERVGKNYRRPTVRTESQNKFELESMRDECSLLKEKCLALESRLERLRNEKEEDARIYMRMLEEAKSALRDQNRQGSSSSANSVDFCIN